MMLPAMMDNNQGLTSGQVNIPVCPREMGEARESMGFAVGKSSCGLYGTGVHGCTGIIGAVVAQIKKEELTGRKKAGIGVA